MNIVVFTLAYGFILAYTLMIQDVTTSVLSTLLDQSSPTLRMLSSRRAVVIIVSVALLFPISLSRSMAGLAKFRFVRSAVTQCIRSFHNPLHFN